MEKDKKIRTIIIILFMFVMIHIILNLWVQSSEKVRENDLAQILKKTADYCKRLDRIALHFVCNEEIKERLYYRGRFFTENVYVYDYQLIRKGGNIQEQRKLLEENGEERNEPNAKLKTQRFWHKGVIFGPIGLLGGDQQPHHDYKIQKEEKYKGDKCYVIEVVPRPGKKTDYLYGKAWVRKSDCSIMKIEWNQESMGNIEKIRLEAQKLGAKPRITFTSEYALEKNGIRFPSRYAVKEEYVRRYRAKISETRVIYKDYKFFIVETEVKIK
jgi:hypothetical protein